MNAKLLVIVLVFALASPLTSLADSDGGSSSEWKRSAVVYLLAPTISGTTGLGRVDADVEVDPKSVFKSLDMAFLGIYLAEKDRWGIYTDIIYMDLSADLETDRGLVSGELGNKQFNLAMAATYRLSDQWQLLAGAMYTYLELKLEVTRPTQSTRRRTSESWVDPMVGARFATELSDKWSVGAMGSIGGFGIGSDLMWTLNASLSYRFSDQWQMMLGYRYIDFDYEEGAGPGRFRFDIAEHGPALGLRYDF
jgi:opacity protein-like surface antigen